MKHIISYKIFEGVGENLYHGNRKGDFPPEKRRFANSIFLTSNLEFAKDFAGFDDSEEFPNGSVWEVTLKDNLNLCNPMEPEIMKKLDLKSIIQKMMEEDYVDTVNGTKFKKVSNLKGYDPETNEEFDVDSPDKSVYHYLWRIKNGAWRIIECEPIIDKISQKYDGFFVSERGSKNVAIFDEKSIKNFKKIL